jgi:peptide/nickel transport system substrate-binding protein
MRSRPGSIAAVIALAVLLGSSRPPSVTAQDEDLTLRVATTQEFDSINPHLSFRASSAEAMILDYDVLVGFGPDLEYEPTGFAESWTSDGTTWTFKIRDGMRWSDGQPADARDVAFTFQYILASKDPKYVGPWAPTGNDLPAQGRTTGDGRPDHPLSLYGDFLVDAVGLRSVELIDDHTVTMTTAHPTTLLLGAYVPILPEHVWSAITFAQATTDFQKEPPVIGTGPFQIASWEHGTSARFVRNPYYWGKKPSIEAVEFRFYPDKDAMEAALRAGDVDYARGVSPDRFDTLATAPDIVGMAGIGSGYTHLAFNTYGTPIDGGGASTTAVRDPRFRDALGYAIDQSAAIDRAVSGHGRPGTTAMQPLLIPFHSEPTTPRRFDPDEATRRLDAAGYRDSDGDGIREDGDGKPIRLRLVYPKTDPKYAAAAQAVVEAWQRVGIAATATGYDTDTLAELMYVPEAGGTADYDVELWGWAGFPDPDFLLSLLTTRQIGVWSDSNYSNPAYDKLFDQQRNAATVEDRQAVVRKMLDLAYDDAPYLVLSYDDELHAHRTDRFASWTVQPRDVGTSLFTYGVQGYLDLVPVDSLATASPTAAATPPATPIATPTPAPAAGFALASDATVPLLVIAGILVAALVVGLVAVRRRRTRRS